MNLRNTWVRLTCGAVLVGCVSDVQAWQQGVRRRVDCSQPKVMRNPAEESDAGNGEPEGTFVPGPANGAVRSGSTTLAVNPGVIRFPSLTLALPSIQLPSISKVRREAAMLVDEQEAPFIRGRVADFDATLTRNPDEEGSPEPPGDPEPESDPGDAPPENFDHQNCPRCYPPCVPPTPREGCVTRNGDANAEQVARLEAQMAMLQKAVAQLVEVQTNGVATRQQRLPAAPASSSDAGAAPVRPAARSQRRDAELDESAEAPSASARPVRQISAQTEAAQDSSADARLLRQQAAQIEELQRQLDALKREQAAAEAPAATATPAATERKPAANSSAGRAKLTSDAPAKKSSNPFSGFLGGLGAKRR